MKSAGSQPEYYQALESRLETKKDPLFQLKTLEELIGRFCFSNVRKAQQLLSDMGELLELHAHFQDFQIKHFIFCGFVENQLYNHEISEVYYTKAVELLLDRGDIRQRTDALLDLAGTYINLERMDEATKCLEKATKLLQSFPDDRLQARWFCREGYINLHYHNFNVAIESFLEAEKLLTVKSETYLLKDYYYLTLIYSGLGNVYERNDERDKSIQFFLKAVQLCENFELKTRLSWHYVNVGRGYLGINDEEKAEVFFQKAIAHTDDPSQQSRASAYGNLGYLSLRNKEYDKALELFDRAEMVYREKSTDDPSNFATINRWRGQLYADLGKDRKALRFFNVAYQQARSVNDYMQLCAICKDIASFYADRRDFQQAYQHQLLYEGFREQYLEEVRQRKTIELEVRYEAQKKKQEAELLKLQATKLQMKALRAQMNPHFMHNALNSIQDFITSGDLTNASIYLSRFSELMRQSLDYSELEIISLEKELEFLENYLLLNKKLRFEGKMDYKIHVDEDIEEDIFGVPTMIVQPYVENAIEHGIRALESGLLGFIRLDFKQLDEDTILCIIEDNGVGREKARQIREADPKYLNHKSKGTQITEERLQILNSNQSDHAVFVEIIDLKDPKTLKAMGTRVEIKIPFTEILEPES